MKKNLLFIILFFCLSCNSQQPKNTVDFKIKKSELEWKNELSKVSFYVLRMQGTEPPFSGKYNNNYQEG
ncbi:MAG: peptide-methionine (R)-S-oxide reductase, partial [Flavobacteriaceae bacterium]|nr:peptide-methionine (R)-S-oxide reductase [Flavobacteriaceae bacterium]